MNVGELRAKLVEYPDDMPVWWEASEGDDDLLEFWWWRYATPKCEERDEALYLVAGEGGGFRKERIPWGAGD